MPSSRPTIRSIATALGVSRSTVSNALRGLHSVNAATLDRVQRAAKSMGYHTHPFASEVMSQLRRGAGTKQLGTLAVLELEEPRRPEGATIFNRRLFEGIKERAAGMGFGVSHWSIGGASMALKRLDCILQARGIQGLLMFPAWEEPDLTALDWSKYTALYIDYLIRRPPLHTISSDHYRTMFNALERAYTLGYRRAGIAIPQRANARVNGRWLGAYFAFLQAQSKMREVPVLIPEEINAENFAGWFKKHRPDVVITHWIDAPQHMAAMGAEIPRTHGYICLNVLPAPIDFSGFDVQPFLIGARSAEQIISQLNHADWGVPKVASSNLVPAQWRDGSTVALQI